MLSSEELAQRIHDLRNKAQTCRTIGAGVLVAGFSALVYGGIEAAAEITQHSTNHQWTIAAIGLGTIATFLGTCEVAHSIGIDGEASSYLTEQLRRESQQEIPQPSALTGPQ